MPSFKRTSLLLAMLMLHASAAYARPPQASLRISSSSFTDGGKMPSKPSCEGANLSPQIQFPPPPSGTKSFALVMDDPDAPVAFTHWLAYGIPANTRELPEGASAPSRQLDHAAEGVNSFGRTGYGGPCPPEGKPHHYVFRIYALDTVPTLPSGASADQVSAAIQGHVLAEGRIIGLYARGGD